MFVNKPLLVGVARNLVAVTVCIVPTYYNLRHKLVSLSTIDLVSDFGRISCSYQRDTAILRRADKSKRPSYEQIDSYSFLHLTGL